MSNIKTKKLQQARKRRLGLAALLLVVLVSVGTTFAFQQLGQQALNPDRVSANPGGRIHDVFLARGDQDVHGPRNKNVFAENFGSMPIGVRVQFQEFLQLNGQGFQLNESATPMVATDRTTWNIIQLNANLERTGAVSTAIGNLNIGWTLGHTRGVYNFMPTFNHVTEVLTSAELATSTVPETSIFRNTHAYAFSDVSGRGVEGIAGNDNLLVAANALIANAAYPQITNIIDALEHLGEQTGHLTHPGTRNYWSGTNMTRQAYRYFIENNTLARTATPETHTARPTLAPVLEIYHDGEMVTFNGVMSITEWDNLGRPHGNFWIFDNLGTNPAHAWFYWNGVLAPGQATSLLLEETVLPIHNDLNYILEINADFFLPNNLPVLRPHTPGQTAPHPIDIINNRPGPNLPANPQIPGLTCDELNLSSEWDCADVYIDPTDPGSGTFPEITGPFDRPSNTPIMPDQPGHLICADVLPLPAGWVCENNTPQGPGQPSIVITPGNNGNNNNQPGDQWTPPVPAPNTCDALNLPPGYTCEDNDGAGGPGLPIVTPPGTSTCADYLPLPHGWFCDDDNIRVWDSSLFWWHTLPAPTLIIAATEANAMGSLNIAPLFRYCRRGTPCEDLLDMTEWNIFTGGQLTWEVLPSAALPPAQGNAALNRLNALNLSISWEASEGGRVLRVHIPGPLTLAQQQAIQADIPMVDFVPTMDRYAPPGAVWFEALEDETPDFR